jgi:hypothetical protein
MLEIGEVRNWLTQDLFATLEGVVHAQAAKGKRDYYILVFSKPDKGCPKVINTKVSLWSKCPMKFVGTSCFRVADFDNVTCLWCLPLDAPGLEVPQEAAPVQIVAESAKGAPILYGN